LNILSATVTAAMLEVYCVAPSASNVDIKNFQISAHYMFTQSIRTTWRCDFMAGSVASLHVVHKPVDLEPRYSEVQNTCMSLIYGPIYHWHNGEKTIQNVRLKARAS